MKIRLFTIPNVITLANLFCGCLAILSALFNDLEMAFVLVILAAVFDFLDGFVARMMKSYSEVGKQLDSLSDVVSFGVAPSMVLYSIYMSAGGTQWWALGAYGVFVVALFSALRLAKFNVDESQKDEFEGLPTPACGILIVAAGFVFVQKEMAQYIHPAYVLGLAVVMSYLLVSPIRMFAFKFHNWSLKDNGLRYGFILASVIGVAIFRVTAIPFIVLGYVGVSMVRNMVCKGARKQA